MARVLIVDDEPDVTTYLATLLQEAGYTITVAASAKSAWTAMMHQPPDLVCLDIMMPKESGISVYRQMKFDCRLRSVRVVLISGAATTGDFDFRNLVADPAIPPPDAYLEKPIQIHQFLAIVAELTRSCDTSAETRKGSHA